MKDNDFTSYSVVNYALSLNKYLWTHANAANIILYYAVEREAKKINVYDHDMWRQIARYYARHRECLPTAIADELDQIEGIEGIFEEGKLDEELAHDLMSVHLSHNTEFSDLCRSWYRFYIAWSGEAKFGLSYNGDKYGYLATLRPLFPEANGVPCSLPLQMLLEAQDTSEAKDIALVAMYSAIRSIVGRKELATTTKAFIHARMFGAKNVQELAEMCRKDKTLKRCAEEWQPDKHRKLFDNMLKALRRRHLLNVKGDKARRCLYVSVSLIDDKEFKAATDEARHRSAHRRDTRQIIEQYFNTPP